ncbi:MAG: hypothetical protein ACU836_06535 [Gammaproteobacteria bacterium]
MSIKEIKFMKRSLHWYNIKIVNVMVSLLISLASPNSLASVILTDTNPNPPPAGIYILWQQGFGFCLIGEPCVVPDGPWVDLQLPTLQIGEQTPISTASPSFGFYLGNSLKGQIDVSLTPVFQIPENQNFVDELTAKIADRTAFLTTTHDGQTNFNASNGEDYYLLLSGYVRGGTTYQLQLSEVPLPGAAYLFGAGLILLLKSGRNRSSLNLAA